MYLKKYQYVMEDLMYLFILFLCTLEFKCTKKKDRNKISIKIIIQFIHIKTKQNNYWFPIFL